MALHLPLLARRTRYLLPLYAAAAAALAIRVWKWHFDQTEIIVTGTICAIAVLVVRQWFRRHRTRDQYATHAGHGACLTTLSEDGLTTTGASGQTVTADWSS
ncbi:hypothetical protein AB0C90_24190 [Streptomyces sp. NPDC048550]|uniref:hypothetical protein n=1 Tax=Streptomyces sp. NPDC048550 TaxID=3155739 RepID=UPI00342F3C9A